MIFDKFGIFFEESFCELLPSMFAADKNVLPYIFPPLFDDIL